MRTVRLDPGVSSGIFRPANGKRLSEELRSSVPAPDPSIAPASYQGSRSQGDGAAVDPRGGSGSGCVTPEGGQLPYIRRRGPLGPVALRASRPASPAVGAGGALRTAHSRPSRRGTRVARPTFGLLPSWCEGHYADPSAPSTETFKDVPRLAANMSTSKIDFASATKLPSDRRTVT